MSYHEYKEKKSSTIDELIQIKRSIYNVKVCQNDLNKKLRNKRHKRNARDNIH